MEEQAAAERQRRATVTTTEGEKSAAILQADGRLEASKRDAQAQVVLAEASQKAIQKVTEAIKENELPVMYLLGEKYIDALKDISSSTFGLSSGSICLKAQALILPKVMWGEKILPSVEK